MPDDVQGAVPRPGEPLEEEIPQAAQAWVGDTAIVFAERDGDTAVLAVHGPRLEWRVVRAPAGRTVRAGPYDLTVTGFGRAHGRDVVRCTVALPG